MFSLFSDVTAFLMQAVKLHGIIFGSLAFYCLMHFLLYALQLKVKATEAL